MLIGGVVTWVNKKSDTKFEYMALFKTIVEAI
jgi:hypothetical protein